MLMRMSLAKQLKKPYRHFMSQKTFNQAAGCIFFIVFVGHALRAFKGWSLVINGYSVSVTLSWAVAALTLCLAWSAKKLL
tara:strand:- start:243 stop:482 length:240 start_codon:yes stop_codon:yes gene_type:complete